MFADRYFELLRTVGRIATAQVREGVLSQQAAEGARLLALEHARAEKGEVAGMLADRSETEQARLIVAQGALSASYTGTAIG